MSGRTLASLFAVLLSAAAPMLGAEPGFAQGLPIPLPGPLNALLANPSQWLVDTVNEALRQLGQDMIGRVLEFMRWLLDSSNVITRTPPELSYANEAVQS